MIKETKLLVALALVAIFVCCRAASLDNEVSADNRPVVEAEVNGRLFRAPVYEDVVYTEAKRQLDARQFGEMKAKLLEVSHLVIVQRKGYFSVAKKGMSFIGLFHNFMKAGAELAKTDTSPALKKTFGPDTSRLVEAILNTKADSSKMSNQEIYERVETLMNGIEQLSHKSPVGLYLDWNKLTIDGEAMPEYIAPTIDWVRHHGYGMMLKVLGMIGGLFKNMGSKSQ